MNPRLQGAREAVAGFGWYPLLLALAWFLQVFAAARVEPPAAYRPLVLTVVIPLVAAAVTIWWLGRDRGTLLAALLVVGLIAVDSPVTLLPFLAAAALLLVERRWTLQDRLHLPWPRVHEALSVLVAVLLTIQVGQLVSMTDPDPMVDPSAWQTQPLSARNRPDIFLLLADAHGRQDVLRDMYGYDDTRFLESLETLGFDVAGLSRANYALTRFSLGSMLTSTYLDRLNTDTSTAFQDALARRTIHDNPAFPLLIRAGYRVTVISSGYEHLGLRSADEFVDTGQPNEFEDAFMNNVAATRLWEALDPDHADESLRDRTRDSLDAVLQMAGEAASGPRFVLAHLPAPHWPYVFDAGCAPVAPTTVGVEGLGRGAGTPETVAAVRAQTACVDAKLADTAAALVDRAPGAVVIVFSDHGPDEHLDWWQPAPLGLNERSANLFAARTPGNPGLFADDITLVNVLPTLLNAYLGTDLPAQPNEFWFGPRPQDNRFVRVDIP